MDAIRFDRQSTAGLVSIIMPTRNGEKYIGQTLATVACQTYPHWELIVVEDGSSGASDIVADFARSQPNNRVDYNRNARSFGAAHSRNLAFTKAAGEFIALLDSDDRWFADHLAVSVEALQTSRHDVVYSTVAMVEDQTDHVLGIWGPNAGELGDLPNSMFGRSFVTPSASVMRREVLSDVGAWNTQLKYCEDFDFWLRCLGAGKSFHCLGGIHCLYRKNHAGATTTKLCGTMEEVAQVTERHMLTPGLRWKHTRRCASKAYALAARLHAEADPARDPSADRSRTPRLLLHAWRLRPTHLDYLYKGVGLLLADKLRPRRAAAPPATTGAEQPPRRLAA
jgi:glycosyltransferase involved in cell wall biosynthesis